MKKLVLIIFIICIMLLLAISQIGLNHTLSELHSFRQTQNAISTYYLIQNGFKLNYITPVLGEPWTIPFEFPLYQGLVAYFQKATGIPLDASGRIISFFFTVLSLFIFRQILKLFEVSSTYSWVLLILFWLNPIWLYWSRTFMIESAAVAFSALFWLGILKYLHGIRNEYKIKSYWVFISLFGGIFAALIKITTFSIFFFVASIQLLYQLYEFYLRKEDKKITIKYILTSLIIVTIPIVLFYIWMNYSDALKSLSYLGRTQTSSALRDWNLGTIQQKASLSTWITINKHSGQLMLLSIFIALYSFIFKHPHKNQIFICCISGFIAPLVFTNLYFVHDYYSFANTPMFIMVSVLFLDHYFKNIKWKGWLLWSSMCLYGLVFYHNNYFRYQIYDNKAMLNAAKIVEKNTNSSDIIFLKEKDWSPEIAYYSKRKVISLPKQVIDSFEKEPLSILKNIKASKVDAFLLFSESKSLKPSEFECVNYYNLDTSAISINEDYVHAKLFLKNNNKQ